MSLTVFNEIVEEMCTKIGIDKDKISNIKYCRFADSKYYVVHIYLTIELCLPFYYCTILRTEYYRIFNDIHIKDKSCVEILIRLINHFDECNTSY